MDRRQFFTGAAALSIGASRILGANDRVRMGIIGIGGRGNAHLGEYLKIPFSQVTGLCDVNQAALERANQRVIKEGQAKAQEFSDMRKMLESKDIDAVSIATPNHWHALASIWAMQHGKDVYCEKPASYNPFESRQMIAAARKHQKMLQIGSQSRSTPHKMEAMKLLNEGIIGKIYLSKGLCFKRRKSIGRMPDLPTPPAGVDWELFLGPAPLRAFNELRFKYNWHWFWDTGNGDIGNQGVHEMDIARWGMGLPNSHEGLKSVVSTGGKYAYDDMQETPNTQMATFDYGDREVVFEVRGVLSGGEAGLGNPARATSAVGNLFYGVDGWTEVDDSKYRVYKGETNELVKEGKAERGKSTTGLHMENFLAGVKSRDHKALTAEIEIGAAAADLCHFANIAYRTGKRIVWDQAKHAFDDAGANRLMTRDYRKPYVVPVKV